MQQSSAPDQEYALELDSQLCFSVYALHHAFARLHRALLEPLGLTYTQYLVLARLCETGSLSMAGLGDGLELDSGTLTPVLRELARHGFIERTRDPRDRRRVALTVTSKGNSLHGDLERIRARTVAATGLEPAELERLTGRLWRIQRSLKDSHHTIGAANSDRE